MPFGVRLEDAAPLQVFFTQAREGIGKEDTLAVFLLPHYHVDKALGDLVGHFSDVYALARGEPVLQMFNNEVR